MSVWTPPGYRDHHQRGETYWCECSGRCTQGAPCDCCELADLRAELADRDRRIDAATGLHWDRHDAFDDRYIDCGVCNRPAPCPTVQALRGEFPR